MASFTELLSIVITADSKGAVAGLGAVGKEAGVTSTNVGMLGGTWEKFKTAMGTTAGQVTAAAAVVVLLGKVVFDAAAKFAAATEPVRAFQRVTGATAEDSSRLTFAMQRLGIDTEQGSKAFFRLGAETQNAQGKFAQYGIEIARNNQGHVDLVKTFGNVSDAYNNMADQGSKNALVADLFSQRMGAKLIPLLQQGSKELKDFYKIAETDHVVFSQEDLNRGREFNRATFDLKSALHGMQVELGQAVIPMVIEFTHAITGAVHAVDGLASLDLGPLGDAGDALSKVNDAVNPLMFAIDPLGGALALFGDEEESSAEKTARLTQKLDEQAQTIQTATDAVWAKIGADLGLQGSSLAVGDALSAQAKAGWDAAAASGLDADANRKSEESGLRVEQAILSVVEASKKKAETDLAGADSLVIARASQQANYDSLVNLRNMYPQLSGTIDGYIAALLRTPNHIHTDATLNASQAIAALQQYIDRFNALDPRLRSGLMAQIGSSTRFNLDGTVAHASGGVFSTPHMGLVAEAGPEAIIPLSRPARAAEVMRQAGLSGGGDTITINVQVAPGADVTAFGQAAHEAIQAYQRRAGMN